MFDGNSILMIIVNSVIPFLVGVIGVWLYYRSKFISVLEELADKKAIISALVHHSDEIERKNVKKLSKDHNIKTISTPPKKTRSIKSTRTK